MLVHHAFRNSKRCTSLLRHLVEQAIDNPTAHIKERTLGIDVFGRDASYDTSLDPIVRNTASDIRKRIGQYYHEGDHQNEPRIELPSGSYMPEFSFNPAPIPQAVQPEAVPELPPEVGPLPAAEQPEQPIANPRRHTWLLGGIVGAVAVLILIGAAVRYLNTPSNAARFWSPLLTAPGRVLICLGTDKQPLNAHAGIDPMESQLPQAALKANETLVQQLSMNDMSAISRIVGVLENRKKEYELRDSDSSKLADLRAGPVILVGDAHNDWTIRLLAPLRFHFDEDSKSHLLRIEDSNHPASTDWAVDKYENYKDIKKDYALVSRYTDGTTGTAVLEVGGLESYGTVAAAEFVSNPNYLNAMGARLSNCKRNIQIVLQVQVMDGTSGPPQVLAVHCW
jgi:hypothetical protein